MNQSYTELNSKTRANSDERLFDTLSEPSSAEVSPKLKQPRKFGDLAKTVSLECCIKQTDSHTLAEVLEFKKKATKAFNAQNLQLAENFFWKALNLLNFIGSSENKSKLKSVKYLCLYELAVISHISNQNDKALHLLETILAANKQHHKANELAYKLFLEKGDFLAARVALKAAIQSKPRKSLFVKLNDLEHLIALEASEEVKPASSSFVLVVLHQSVKSALVKLRENKGVCLLLVALIVWLIKTRTLEKCLSFLVSL